MINCALVLAVLIWVSEYLDKQMMCPRMQYGFSKKVPGSIKSLGWLIRHKAKHIVYRQRQAAENQSDVRTSRWIRCCLTDDTQEYTLSERVSTPKAISTDMSPGSFLGLFNISVTFIRDD